MTTANSYYTISTQDINEVSKKYSYESKVEFISKETNTSKQDVYAMGMTYNEYMFDQLIREDVGLEMAKKIKLKVAYASYGGTLFLIDENGLKENI